MIDETRGITIWALSNWLKSDFGRKQCSKLIIEQVLQDEAYILPGLHLLLMNYLRSDFKIVSNVMEKAMIDLSR